MSKKETAKKLSQVKTALADKCDRLIRTTKSVPRRKKLKNLSARFRRQAADLGRK